MVLHWWYQRLNDEHVGLAAVRFELHAEAIVAEDGRGRRAQRHFQAFAQRSREVGMRMPTEDDDSLHAKRGIILDGAASRAAGTGARVRRPTGSRIATGFPARGSTCYKHNMMANARLASARL